MASGSGDTDLGQALTVVKPSKGDYGSAPACCAIPPSNPWVEEFPKLYPLFRLNNWGRLDGPAKRRGAAKAADKRTAASAVSRALD